MVDTKKKWQVFQVSVGSGRLWYYNPDALQVRNQAVSVLRIESRRKNDLRIQKLQNSKRSV